MSGRRQALNQTPTRRAPTRRQSRSSAAKEPAVPDVFQEMLLESGIPLPSAKKRRKVVKAEDDRVVDTAWPTAPPLEPGPSRTLTLAQEVEATPESVEDETDDDEDVDWEDVDLTAVSESNRMEEGESRILEVTLNDPNQKSKSQSEKRRVTAVDRKIRLEAHKLHLLCLLAHVSRRNIWCNNSEVQVNLSSCGDNE